MQTSSPKGFLGLQKSVQKSKHLLFLKQRIEDGHEVTDMQPMNTRREEKAKDNFLLEYEFNLQFRKILIKCNETQLVLMF